jgi:hypothetical protein
LVESSSSHHNDRGAGARPTLVTKPDRRSGHTESLYRKRLYRKSEDLRGPAVGAANRLVEWDGAEAVILVGAVTVDRPRAIEGQVPVPMVEGIAAACSSPKRWSVSACRDRDPAASGPRRNARS